MISLPITALMILLTCFTGMLGGTVEMWEGAVLVTPPIVFSGFQLSGFIFSNQKEDSREHEYGHYLHELDIGLDRYIVEAGFSSLIVNALYVLGDRSAGVNYGDAPGERAADELAAEYFK